MTIEVELPIRFWRLRERLLGFKGEVCEHCHKTIFFPRPVCPNCSAIKRVGETKDKSLLSTTFGIITFISEISKNGHQREQREFVIEVNLDSGFSAKLLYKGRDLRIGGRVRIDDERVGNGVRKVVSVLKNNFSNLPNSSSRIEAMPEVSRSSK